MGLSDQRRRCLDCIVLLAGLYHIGWIILYRLDSIVSSVFCELDCIRKHCILCAGWLLDGWDVWDGWTGWDVGRTGVV